MVNVEFIQPRPCQMCRVKPAVCTVKVRRPIDMDFREFVHLINRGGVDSQHYYIRWCCATCIEAATLELEEMWK